MKRGYVLGLLLVTIAVAVAADAACVPQGDDPGCFTTDRLHSRCEQKAGANAAKLAQGILKCHRTMADRTQAGKTFDEEACEASAVQKLSDRTDVTDCPCIDVSAVATLWETLLDSSNDRIYCAPGGVAFGGDDSGRAPVTVAQARCEGGLTRCVASLVKNRTKCHASAAKAAVKGLAFDEEACEEGPIPSRPGKAAAEQYDACITRVLSKGGCAGCEDPAAVASVVESVIDGHNDAIYCMDQPPDVCPSTYEFTAAGNVVDQDIGWAGFWHDEPLTSNVRLTLAVGGCANATPPCGACTLTGPIANAGGPTFASRRCRGADNGSNGSWIACTSTADCPGAGNDCVFFLGAPQPVAFGGLSTCVTTEIAGSILGTLDADTGAAALSLSLIQRTYGISLAYVHPCPRCVAGTCDSGNRQGSPCVVNGTSATYGDDVSFDCPPPLPTAGTPSPLSMVLTTGAQTATLAADSPPCTASGYGGFRCMCDTCDNAATTPCFTDAQCAAIGATHCGGRRCVGGSNHGAPCTAASQCANGGGCGRVGPPTRPNGCDDVVCSPNTPPDADSSNEGVCAAGPFELYCDAEPYRGCRNDADCALGDTCSTGKFRECFTDNGTIGGSDSVSGVASTTTPTFAALFCAPPNGHGFIDVRGLPGLARLTIPGVASID